MIKTWLPSSLRSWVTRCWNVEVGGSVRWEVVVSGIWRDGVWRSAERVMAVTGRVDSLLAQSEQEKD